MSTRSRIGIINGSQVKSIYCHFDGGLAHNGCLLFLYYNSVEKIDELINLGNLSTIGKGASKNLGTIAYVRDGGEDELMNKHSVDRLCIKELKQLAKIGLYDYMYFFKTSNCRWYMWNENKNKLCLLELEIISEIKNKTLDPNLGYVREAIKYLEYVNLQKKLFKKEDIRTVQLKI